MGLLFLFDFSSDHSAHSDTLDNQVPLMPVLEGIRVGWREAFASPQTTLVHVKSLYETETVTLRKYAYSNI